MTDAVVQNGATAQAGRAGPGVRSDCRVTITRTGAGGIELDLKSRVESMYGDATRCMLMDEFDALGLADAKVDIQDAGALPFVIMARVETAVRRLGAPVGQGFLPPWGPGTDAATQRDRLRRSRLYLPGNEPKFMLNAGLHGPDAVILDLEDSVAPAEKDAARILVRNALRCVDFHTAERMVRINQGDRGLEDLDVVAGHNVHVVLIPKVEHPDHVRAVHERIRAVLAAQRDPAGDRGPAPRHTGSPERRVYLMPIIESALGAIRAYDIATASKQVVALAIGLEDYTADIGAARTKDGRESFWARAQVLNAARAAGVQPIDTVFSDVADTDGLRASVVEARSLGFEGKGCIHPRQIPVIHDAFAPTPDELERARNIVAAFHDAQANGLSVVSLGTKMIDPPVVKRAQRIVRMAGS
ncbi:MAG: aldolase/citrate lyase family protein [Phycisphaerae bacterium]